MDKFEEEKVQGDSAQIPSNPAGAGYDQIPAFGSGGGQSANSKPAKKTKMSGHDQAVMMTSNDALVTKVYAAQLGYFMDNHAKLFLKNKRKLYPLINRGTWARVQAYRQVILNFINAFAT